MDFFLTKREQLENWMSDRRVFATHEVIKWGTENYYNRAAQTKSDILADGFIRKLDDKEKAYEGYKCKDDVYIWIGTRKSLTN